MNRKFDVFPILYGIIGVVQITCGAAIIARDYERSKAIDADVGAWVIDAKSGVCKFEYGVMNERDQPIQ